MPRPVYPATERAVAALPEPTRAIALSWRLSLLAANLSPRTIQRYLETVTQFASWLADNSCHSADTNCRPADIIGTTPGKIAGYLADLATRTKPSTVDTRYRSLRTFYRWLVDEGEIDRSPMERIRPPVVPASPPPIVPDDALVRLLKTCEGRDFLARRDTAIVRVLIDTGMRRGELVGLELDDVDLQRLTVTVLGKGRRVRVLPLGHKAALALNRYLRTRAAHPFAHRPELWIGAKGPLTDEGVYDAFVARCRAAGLAGVHPHLLRHLFAHTWLAAGGGETDLMHLAGWSSRQMLARYGASAAAERARDAHRRLRLGDRL